MALTGSEIIIAPFGHVYVAPLGTTQPVDSVSAWPAGWLELGYTDEKGVTITPTLTTVNLMAWQSAAPVKALVTESALEVAFALRQFDINTTGLFFFGATWSLSSGSTYILNVPSSPTVDQRMLGIEWGDGTTTNRLIIPTGLVTKHDNIVLDRKDGTILGVTFTALDTNGTLASLLSNSAYV